jgi:hypothetical protein
VRSFGPAARGAAFWRGATTALHDMKIPVTPAGLATLARAATDPSVPVHFLVRHAALAVRTPLPVEIIRALANDLPRAAAD